jgi:hypothetical protein
MLIRDNLNGTVLASFFLNGLREQKSACQGKSILVEMCLHLANVLYLVSFLGRDMLWLRALTCAGLSLGIVFFSCQAAPLYGPTAWHVVFLAINGLQIVRMSFERRELMLTKEQEKVADASFHELSREDLGALLTHLLIRNPPRVGDIPGFCHQPLTPEERALHDIALRRLSRQELQILLTRRMWKSLKRRWRRKACLARKR